MMDFIKKRFLLWSLVVLFAPMTYAQYASKYVNPMIGTKGMGHTFPGACVPFGSVQLSPDTDTIPHNIDGKYQPNVYAYCAGYQHNDTSIVGFSHTHLSGTGHSDLGDILIMPTTGILHLNPGTASEPEKGYRSRFSHDTEEAYPGYYKVNLKDYAIKAELAAASHTGIHRYTYPKTHIGHLILDLTHGIYNYKGKTLWSSVRVENDTLITGYRITNGWSRCNYTHFAISFSKPIKKFGYVDKQKMNYSGFWHTFDIHHNFPEMAGRGIACYFDFDFSEQSQIEVRVGTSAVSTQGALLNLRKETEGKTFDELRNKAQKEWKKELSLFNVKGTEDQKTLFYTSLYHTMINPSIYMDVDHKYRGLDNNIHESKRHTNYTIFSLWDTYRALHPLLNIIKPKQSEDMLKSLLCHQQQSVHNILPIWSHMGNENWCMTGYHAVSVLADGLLKGMNLDVPKTISAMQKTSKSGILPGLNSYREKGYIPTELSSVAVSTTLEYAYDDWSIYQVAKKKEFKEIAEEYKQRAFYYKNVFHPTSGYAQPKKGNGEFRTSFDPLQTTGEGFIEGNSANFSFHVPHDVKGLIKSIGGEKRFVNRLDQLFKEDLPEKYYAHNEDVTKACLIGGYVHGNEPSHHIPYLYAWTSKTWKMHYWLREIMNKMYQNRIDGLGGNDDCGQMSAWYIFTSMGYYPVCPGSNQYILGAPYLPYVAVELPNNKKWEVVASKVSDKKRYVKAVYLNGKRYTKRYITYETIMKGGKLVFIMSSKPHANRIKNSKDMPYSLSDEL